MILFLFSTPINDGPSGYHLKKSCSENWSKVSIDKFIWNVFTQSFLGYLLELHFQILVLWLRSDKLIYKSIFLFFEHNFRRKPWDFCQSIVWMVISRVEGYEWMVYGCVVDSDPNRLFLEKKKTIFNSGKYLNIKVQCNS